ncbi:MAG TPA: tetratricopeptide repeat protein [Nitrospira sp.]|nr:tetratricopeptide repeat protein [Nitrospira sp.]
MFNLQLEPVSSEPDQLRHEDAVDWYERGIALRKAGLFKQAIEEFEKAKGDAAYALKAYAHIGLCHKSIRQYEQAVAAFRNALQSPRASAKETVQLLYVLGRTLESLGRNGEALEAYRWLRREDPQFRDVAERIESLSAGRRVLTNRRTGERRHPWSKHASDILQNFRWISK